MATLAVIGIMGATSAALVGAAALTNELNKSASIPAPEVQPEPVPEPTPVPEPEPVAEPTPVPESVPEPEPVAEPEPVMTGGAIGQPPWGNISSTPLPKITTGITDAIGLPPNPRDLQIELTDLNDELENAQLRAYQANSEVKKILEFDYKNILQKYAVAYSKSEGAKKKQENSLKILNAKPGKKDKNTLVTLKNKLNSDKISASEKAELALRIAEEEAKPDETLKPKDLEDAAEKYEALVKDRVSADFELEELKRDKAERDNKITELRKVEDAENSKVKDLRAKRDALLVKVNQLNQPARKLPLDWDARRKRYGDATAGYSLAETRFRTFYTETWIPSEYDPERESKYGSRLNVLKKALDAAKVELDRARVGLTAPEKAVESMARDDIDEFIQHTKSWFGNDYSKLVSSLQQDKVRYLPVLEASKFSDKPVIRKLADVYYELAGMNDVSDVLKNLDRILVVFRDTQIKPVTDFINKLSLAVRPEIYTNPATDEELRKNTKTFVDKQFSNIRHAKAVILQAKNETRIDTGKTVKNLQELKTISDNLFKEVPELSALDSCETVMTPESFSAFGKNEYNGSSITSILVGNDEVKKNDFFKKFLIRKISNKQDAENYVTDLSYIQPVLPELTASAAELVQNPPAKPEFYIRTQKSIENINVLLKSCTIENNTTKRSEIINIRKILEQINKISSSTPGNPLDALIIQLQEEHKIFDRRGDQGVIIAKANTVGFSRLNPVPSIIEVNDKNLELNAMETFLTLRSVNFKSIPSTDTTLYGGKIENTRDVYARLAFNILKGLPAFADWDGKIEDTFFQTRLARQFNLNFVILDEVSGNIKPMATQRLNADFHFIFKRSDGKFFPVRFGDPETSEPRAAPFGKALDGGLRYIPRQVTDGWHRRTVSWQRSKPSRLTRRKI